jgi:hypothetical protein
MKGLAPVWCEWIARFVQGGSVGIRVNDDIGHYFQTLKGLWQGDPLSPILFNIVADMLAILIARAKEDGQVGGLIPHLVDGGISILQYADATILFMEHDLVKTVNMKLILAIFEQLSDLKINFHKSELYYFGKAKDVGNDYRTIFGFEIGSFPFIYLGIPIHYRKLLNKEWKPVEDRFEKKLATWLGKLLSYGDRLVLINLVLTSLLCSYYHSLKYQRVFGGDWIITGLVSSGKVMNLKRSTDLLDGTLFLDQKTKGV